MNNIKLRYQFLISLSSVLIIFSVSFLLRDHIYYRSVGYLMLFMVSILAMFFDIIPVLSASVVSALSWAFFFLKPIYSVKISNSEDQFLMIMYLIISLINIILTRRIKKIEELAKNRKEKDKIISLYNTLFNSLSHELKTPISTIQGATELLSENEISLDISNQKILLQDISIASQRLNYQINNLLNMSRLESGVIRLNIEWVQIEELVSNVLKLIDLKNQNHKVVVSISEDMPILKFDSHLIEQAIYNLLINALFYTPEESKIELRFTYFNSFLKVVVSDNGKGISEKYLPFMFDKFFRIDSSKTGGTGLGLSIVKGIVEAHDGKVMVKNNTFGGAEFTLSIPCDFSPFIS